MFALMQSLPAVFNIGTLLLFVVYIYGVMGTSLFGAVKLSGGLNVEDNFKDVFSSVLLLIRLATSAGWNDILDPLLIQPPDCDPDYFTLPDGSRHKSQYGECGIPWIAIPYMVSYIFIVYLILINLYIAVILENFYQAHQQEEIGVTDEDFEMFYQKWEIYDSLATEFIHYNDLSDFVDDLEPPLRVPKPNGVALASFDVDILEAGVEEKAQTAETWGNSPGCSRLENETCYR
nr:hypothetical protein BaRGS_028653 [Batillaria attramentaria]